MVKHIFKKSTAWIHQEHQSILSAAAIISASYLASAFLGLIRNRLLAARFFGGLEADLDVYFAASVIPDTIFQLLIIGALSAVFIPTFQDYLNKSSKQASLMANATLTTLTSLLGLVILLLIIFAHPIANLITHFSPSQTNLLANLIRIFALSQIFFTISAFLTCVLQSHRRFLVPAIAPLFYNLGIILGILFLSPKLGIYSAAIGSVIGALLHLLIQLPLAKTLNFVPQLVFRLRHPGSINIFRSMPPRSAALGISQVERYVIVNLTSILAAGSLTIFSFARQLYLLPVSLFGVALGQASFPSLSQQASQKDNLRFQNTLTKSLLQAIFFSLPASILLLVLRIPLVRLAFGTQHFPWEATLLTGKTLALLAISIAPQATTHVLVRAFYAQKDTKTPLVISFSTLLIFIFLGFFFTHYYSLGILGIALALTLSNLIDFFLLYHFLSQKIGSLHLGLKFLKMGIAGFFTALFLWAPMRLLDEFVFDTTRTLPLIALTLIVSLIGILVYLGLSALFKVEELSAVVKVVNRLGNWRQILSRSDEVIETPTTQE